MTLNTGSRGSVVQISYSVPLALAYDSGVPVFGFLGSCVKAVVNRADYPVLIAVFPFGVIKTMKICLFFWMTYVTPSTSARITL